MSNFGKGITVASGFDLSAKAPLDSRIVVNNYTELNEHVKNNRVYDGMIVYVIEEQTTVQYVNKSWIPFGSDINQGANVVIDNLNSILVNAALSANQGRILREMIEAIKLNFYTTKEIDTIKEILEQKDEEILEKFDNISEYLPTKISYFDNDMNFITRGNLEDELRYIKIPVKTSDLINDAGYITKENIEENVVSKIPIKTSQLENDAEYITKQNLEDALSGIDTNIGDGFVYIGTSEPTTEYLWVDTSTPSNLKVINYESRIRLKYSETLELTKNKLSNLDIKMNLIETDINKISSNNVDKITTFKTTLATTRNQITILISQINDLQYLILDENEDLIPLKSNTRQLRKSTKNLIYSLIDFNDEIVRVLDNELIFDYSGEGDGGNSGDNNDDIVVNNASILTEDGIALLTEDGLLILADGIEEIILPNNAIVTESGNPLLTESGLILLADEIDKNETLVDAILTELGYVLMTENEKQILKG